MEVTIKQVEGLTFLGKANSNHWVAIDGPRRFNGSEAASRPMELLLIALGSCTGSDVASILQKKRVAFSDFTMTITAERSEEHPKVFTTIHVQYNFVGNDLKETAIKQAIELSQNTYCPIAAMLKKTVKLSYSLQITPKHSTST